MSIAADEGYNRARHMLDNMSYTPSKAVLGVARALQEWAAENGITVEITITAPEEENSDDDAD